jgi:hypothetical protein
MISRPVLLIIVLALTMAPVAARAAPDAPDPGVVTEDTILGMTYDKAATVAAAVTVGAVVVNMVVGANIGTILGALYVGHLMVEAALVASGAGAGWGLGLWDDNVPAGPPTN